MSSTEAGLAEEAAPTDTDEFSSALLAEFTSAIGAASVVESHIQRGDLWIRVRRDDWKRAALTCRDMGFEYFCFLSGIDWMPSTAPNPKASVSDSIEGVEDEPESEAPEEVVAETDGMRTGYAGGDTRFQVFARLYSVSRHQGITLKADLDDDAPSAPSIIDIYPGADWSEREAWEMYGFDFVGHPHLVHLYLPGEFEGFPQRKDFPLLSREVKPWPGLVDVEPMPDSGEPDAGEGDAAATDSGEAAVTATGADPSAPADAAEADSPDATDSSGPADASDAATGADQTVSPDATSDVDTPAAEEG